MAHVRRPKLAGVPFESQHLRLEIRLELPVQLSVRLANWNLQSETSRVNRKTAVFGPKTTSSPLEAAHVSYSNRPAWRLPFTGERPLFVLTAIRRLLAIVINNNRKAKCQLLSLFDKMQLILEVDCITDCRFVCDFFTIYQLVYRAI